MARYMRIECEGGLVACAFDWSLVPSIPRRATHIFEERLKYLFGDTGPWDCQRDFWFYISPFYPLE